jgi:hypothetical protein
LFTAYGGGFWNDSTFVFVDPHVLSSPVLVDVNGDGNMEIVMAVSYYFDKVEYAGKFLYYLLLCVLLIDELLFTYR